MKLTANSLRSTKLVQVMYTNGKYDYVHEHQLKELQAARKLAYLV